MYDNKLLTEEEILAIISNENNIVNEELKSRAKEITKQNFNNNVFLQGKINFTNNCTKNCIYCGLQNNENIKRYRLTTNEILEICQKGYNSGIRNFLLQGGDDAFYTEERLSKLISRIVERFEDCSVGLSVGERNYSTYKKYFFAGADTYILKHKTANKNHFKKLHPSNSGIEERIACLNNLKEIGFSIGSGIMVDSPDQTIEYLLEDIMLLKDIEPEIINISSYIPYQDINFKNKSDKVLNLILNIISIVRIILPNSYICCSNTIALLNSDAINLSLESGANMINVNISPDKAKNLYTTYCKPINYTKFDNIENIITLLENLGYTAKFNM